MNTGPLPAYCIPPQGGTPILSRSRLILSRSAPGRVRYRHGAAPDGRMLVVALPRANQVAVVDLRPRSVVHRIGVPPAPQMALMRPDGRMVCVSCDRSGQIAAIRTSDRQLEALIPAGKEVDGLARAK